MPRVVGSAYTNSFFSADAEPDRRRSFTRSTRRATRSRIQNPPNNGTLTNPQSLGFDVADQAGFDIAGDDNVGFIATGREAGLGPLHGRPGDRRTPAGSATSAAGGGSSSPASRPGRTLSCADSAGRVIRPAGGRDVVQHAMRCCQLVSIVPARRRRRGGRPARRGTSDEPRCARSTAARSGGSTASACGCWATDGLAEELVQESFVAAVAVGGPVRPGARHGARAAVHDRSPRRGRSAAPPVVAGVGARGRGGRERSTRARTRCCSSVTDARRDAVAVDRRIERC